MKAQVIAHVYETYDYDAFKKMNGNRSLTIGRLNKLVASFRAGRILCPITVNAKMEIVDGQGRFEACKALGMAINFVIDPDATIDDCRRMNRYNTHWTVTDFIHSYAEMGNENYQIFLRAYESTKLTIQGLMRVIHKINARQDVIEKGRLKFSENDEQKAYEVNKFIQDFKESMIIPSITKTLESALIIAYETDGFDPERMIRNARKNRMSFVVMAKLPDMLKELTRIYNYRASKNSIYFEDYLRKIGADQRDYSEANISGLKYAGSREPDVSTLRKAK